MAGNVYRFAAIGLRGFDSDINAGYWIADAVNLYRVLIINHSDGVFQYSDCWSFRSCRFGFLGYRCAHNIAGAVAVVDGVGELPGLPALHGFRGKAGYCAYLLQLMDSVMVNYPV